MFVEFPDSCKNLKENEPINTRFRLQTLVKGIKIKIKESQIKAALSVNSQLILLYWDLGRQIVEKQENVKWGSSFINQLSKDLKSAFPEITGFSDDNLRFMRRLFLFYK